METSIFIAQLLWPIMFLLWIRLLFTNNIFKEAKAWLKNEPLSVMMTSLWWAIAWILMVVNHNVRSWEPWVILITLLWWIILVKSSILIAFPKCFNKLVDNINYPNWLIKFFWILYILMWICFIYRWFM